MPQAPWFTVEFTFHSGHCLPVADVHNLSSDPFIEAVITCAELPNYKDDPPLLWRTPTMRHTREPVWDCKWRVSGIPASGFHLAMKVKDEDARDRDDRLGKAYLDLTREQMHDGFELVHHKAVVMKRKGSIVPYITTYLTAILPGQHLLLHPRIELSVKVVAMQEDPPLERPYTIGPNKYSRHFSPLIGRVVLDPPEKKDKDKKDPQAKQISTSSFSTNKLQLTGPVPPELRHRFVPYRPFIDWLFLKSGPWGWILNAGLHKQYRTLYSYDKNTEYGVVHSTNGPIGEIPPTPVVSMDMASTFLKMTSHGEGERIFTYVITLDGEWRFCETGAEFAIDLLSKHSMHANVAKEVAFSGEFFVRKKVDHHSHHNGLLPNGDLVGPPPESKEYELVIDNESGTYQPKKEFLPILQEWLSRSGNLGSLGGVLAVDGFDETLKKWKCERKAAKRDLKMGKVKLARSGSSVSSLSSSELGGGGSVSSDDIEDAIRSHEERLEQPFATGKSEAVQES